MYFTILPIGFRSYLLCIIVSMSSFGTSYVACHVLVPIFHIVVISRSFRSFSIDFHLFLCNLILLHYSPFLCNANETRTKLLQVALLDYPLLILLLDPVLLDLLWFLVDLRFPWGFLSHHLIFYFLWLL